MLNKILAMPSVMAGLTTIATIITIYCFGYVVFKTNGMAIVWLIFISIFIALYFKFYNLFSTKGDENEDRK